MSSVTSTGTSNSHGRFASDVFSVSQFVYGRGTSMTK